jgi:hypothetical protein
MTQGDSEESLLHSDSNIEMTVVDHVLNEKLVNKDDDDDDDDDDDEVDLVVTDFKWQHMINYKEQEELFIGRYRPQEAEN